ncbi:hypothetical protein QJQ45_016702 [Haematococcus lacustris]|nr:hypothetical protein QJQ45_016702 [Haematococcus lacustris]
MVALVAARTVALLALWAMGFQRPGSRSQHAFGVTFDGPKSKAAAKENKDDEPSILSRANAQLPVARCCSLFQTLLKCVPCWHMPMMLRNGGSRCRRELLYLVEQHATVIVLGDTGSGKTTQIPQFLHEAGWTAGGMQVACTQPRRAAAASVAARVAEEQRCELGGAVGYAVRFDAVVTEGVTRIKFLTDGVLLREMMDDPLLTQYSVVMVDEAHERSLATDMVLGLLKKVQRRRPDLRLIVSSATLQVDQLRSFFEPGSAPPAQQVPPPPGLPAQRSPAVMHIPGRTFPVEVHYLQQPVANYVNAAVATVLDLHKADLPGDVLVFLTGQFEVEAAVRQLDEAGQKLRGSSGYRDKLLPLPLYAGLPAAAQQLALAPTPRGFRKVVVATNIAETSLTLEGVVYVVDSCFVKQRAYNPLLGLEALCAAPCSQASAAQRAGRAGRVRAGKAFRLCTEEHFKQLLPAVTVPEMQRSDLSSMVMQAGGDGALLATSLSQCCWVCCWCSQLKALGIDNIMKFEWLSPPPAEAMVRALEALAALKALDGDARLTRDVGLLLAALPLEPQLGKALLASYDSDVSCSEEMLTIVACVSAAPHGLFVAAGTAGVSRKVLMEAKARFAVAEGDMVTLLNVWRGWCESGRSKSWAQSNCINHHALHKADEVRQQLEGQCRRLGLPHGESCDSDMTLVRKALVSGLFMNAAAFERTDYDPMAPESDPGTHVYRLVRPVGGSTAMSGSHDRKSVTSGAVDSARLRLRVHAHSVLARCRPQWLVFHTVQQSDSGWYEMQGVTAIQSEWLTERAPHYYRRMMVKRGQAPKQDSGKRVKHTTPNQDPSPAVNVAIASDADVAELTQDVLTTCGHNVRAATSASYSSSARRYDDFCNKSDPRLEPTDYVLSPVRFLLFLIKNYDELKDLKKKAVRTMEEAERMKLLVSCDTSCGNLNVFRISRTVRPSM